MTSHSLEVTYGVTDGVHSHMAHVQSTRWVWKHGEDIKLLPVGILGNAIMDYYLVYSFQKTSREVEKIIKIHYHPERQQYLSVRFVSPLSVRVLNESCVEEAELN